MDVRRSLYLPGLTLLAGLAQAHTHGPDHAATAVAPDTGTRFHADRNRPWPEVLHGCVNAADLDKDHLLSGLGGTRYALVTLKDAERVEAFYSQGIALQYGFNFAEATRAFYQASRLDEGAAMPYWGIALSANSNINSDATAGCNLLAWRSALIARDNASKRLDDPQARERFSAQQLQREADYANALLTLYRVDGEDVVVEKEGKQAYAAAMKQLSEKYPDDLDAATLYADALLNLAPWKWWEGNEDISNQVKPTGPAYEALQVLNRVLVQDRQHTGANHFYIHAIEESPFPDSGLPMAERFRTQNPAIGHLVHMASHIYQRTGNNTLASATNYTAVSVDRAYLKEANPQSPYALHYLGHNIHFLTWTLSIEGRQNEVMTMAGELLDNTTEFAAQAFLCKQYPDEIRIKSDYFYAVPYYFAVRFQDWDALERFKPKIEQGLATINQACKAADGNWQDLTAPYTHAMQAYAEAYRQLARPGLDNAAAQAALKTWWQQVNASRKESLDKTGKELAYGSNRAVELMRIANLILINQAQERLGDNLDLNALKQVSAQVFTRDTDQALATDLKGLSGDHANQVLGAWRKAVEVQDALSYNEPPDWYYTLRESLGYALLDQQRNAEAEQAFREDLAGNRQSGRSLNGLKVSLQKQGKPVPALLDEELATAWRNATVSAAPQRP